MICSCCGVMALEEDGSLPEADEGDEMCLSCGGDPEAGTTRKKMGWAACCFFDARVPIIRERLSVENQPKWDKIEYWRKVSFITKQIEAGNMI